MSHAKEIKFRSEKIILFSGLFFLIMAVVIAASCLSGFQNNGSEEEISLLAATVIFACPLALMGAGCIFIYFKSNNDIQKVVKKYGKENLISHIENATIKAYKSPLSGEVVYFTDRFVIDPKQTVIEYGEIAQMYQYGRKGVTYLAVKLLSGKTVSLCSFITDEEIVSIMQLCCRQNPGILLVGMPQK